MTSGFRTSTDNESVWAGKVDAGQPEPGRVELVRGGQHRLLLPQAVQSLDAGPLDHAVDERLAPLVVRALELQPEQSLDEPLGLAPLDAVALHRLVDLVERGDEAPADLGEHVVGVALDDGGEPLQLLPGAT